MRTALPLRPSRYLSLAVDGALRCSARGVGMRAGVVPALTVVAAAVGCGPVNSANALARRCDVEDGAYNWSEETPLHTDCAVAIGRLLSIDWGSFDAEPSGVAMPLSIAETVVIGGSQLSFSDTGDVGSLKEENSSIGLHRYLDDWQSQYSLAEDVHSNVFWQHLLRQEIDACAYDPAIAPTTAAYRLGELRIGELIGGYSASEVAALLVHEVGHAFSDPHVPCFPGSDVFACDTDSSGTLGLQATWLHLWLAENSAALSQAEVDTTRLAIIQTCANILDTAGLSACE